MDASDRTWGPYGSDVMKLINKSAKWAVPVEARATFVNDGIDTVCTLTVDSRLYLGHTKCGKRDTFDETLGMAIALGRACKKYHIRNNRHQARESNHAQSPL